ncbi:glutamate-5-semialdehyde dehydrogenase [Biomaibacter acetigenes]|uniref:Gamma-glutamyl phosphate reductase n=1 Tax=Biomaibacter acetigenes TaxID=2316383 RepID=A0A3G2R5F3_9FIRM|nr:glutamate-5-semialdehyde dehydrogenase [Biomaibacter acetigenes]AYO30107.1 glutamate-5-semialdehyde dehydrogenase [Biomaibacter acetigenes]
MDIQEIGKKAKEASRVLASLFADIKNRALSEMAASLMQAKEKILLANERDINAAREKGMSEALVDRLKLNESRIFSMVKGLKDLCDLPDPVGQGEVIKRPNGLTIMRQHVPFGVIGIIYEARPNVTSDAAGLCLKAGSSVILRGGSEAINSNKAIVSALVSGAVKAGIPEGAIQLIEDTGHESAIALMKMRQYVDLLIPRGGAGLIKTVVENSTVPVIETGVGNCHVYVDESADLEMAKNIIINAKTSRPSVCNAAETLLVHKSVAERFIPDALKALEEKGVELRGCIKTRQIFPGIKPASEEDWAAEYLDLILAVKVVDDIDEAIEHINRYGSSHSEAIVTKNYDSANKFLSRVDAACVYVNASTRFTDGGEFGFGAEIGISTQKLHARGPMGLKELTTVKYLILGDGQVRL